MNTNEPKDPKIEAPTDQEHDELRTFRFSDSRHLFARSGKVMVYSIEGYLLHIIVPILPSRAYCLLLPNPK